MTAPNRVIVELTREQREEIKNRLGKEVRQIYFRLIGGDHLMVDLFDVAEDK